MLTYLYYVLPKAIQHQILGEINFRHASSMTEPNPDIQKRASATIYKFHVADLTYSIEIL